MIGGSNISEKTIDDLLDGMFPSPLEETGGSNAVYMRELDNTKRFPSPREVIGGSNKTVMQTCFGLLSFRTLSG